MNVGHYEALKAYGHSPMKAMEIELDARRGQGYAVLWLKMVLSIMGRNKCGG